MQSKKTTIYLITKVDSLLSGFAEANSMSKSEASAYLISRGLENIDAIDRAIFEIQSQQKQFNRLAGLIIQVYKQAVISKAYSKVASIRQQIFTQEETEQLENQAIKKAFESLRAKEGIENE